VRRVLFVDDEPKILDGLRRMLRSLRREWQMDFAEGGRDALARLVDSPYDVVVTDMRMPGMDGAELLREVMIRCPSTVRIVLSGQCDRQTALEAVDSTHQFLTKPCDPELLIATLIHACQLRDNLADRAYRELVSRLTCVPSLPAAYDELIAELNSAAPSIRRIGETFARDAGMTAKIMQLIHSSFFGPAQRISDPVQAVSLFDVETIRALVSTTAAFAPFRAPDLPPAVVAQQVEHNRAVAVLAREIAIAEGRDASVVEDAYLAGLLHDVGILVIAEHMPRSFLATLAESACRGTPVCDVEQSSDGATHADIGGYLAALWGLPPRVVEAISLHHYPRRSADREFSVLTAVHVGGVIDSNRIAGAVGAAPSMDLEYLERIGCTERLPAWREICHSVQREGACV